jgi:hypothetical protein
MNSNARFSSRISRTAALLAAFVLGAAADVRAQGWNWNVTPYVWTTDVGVNVSLGGRPVVDKTIAFADLIKDLDMATQVRVEASRGRFGLMTDLFDVRLSTADQQLSLPMAGGAKAAFNSKISMTIVEAGATYSPQGAGRGLSLLFGSRMLSQRAAIDARFADAPESTTEHHESNDFLVDALAGAQFDGRLSNRWGYRVRGDISAGGTKHTWSGGADLAYRLDRNGRYTATAGYRRMVVAFDSEQSINTDMTLSGLVAGVRVSF